MNLRILRRTRKTLKPGDIFVLQARDHEFVFGRVIRTDARHGGFEECVLVYIYAAFSADKSGPSELDRDRLLIPPLLTGKYMWTRGYFEPVGSRPLEQDDVLPQHCFYSFRWGESYYDEFNNRLPERVEPCGSYSIYLPRGVDRDISIALGIPLSEDHASANDEHDAL